MMNNLFSSFDPSINNSNLWLNWASISIVLTIPTALWVVPSKFLASIMMILKLMNKEAMTLMKKKELMNSIIYSSTTLFIITNNFMGLMPYIFTSTGHLSISLPLSTIMWTSIIIFSMKNNTNKMLAHLVPSGTPSALMSFMVIIESISIMIRPIALSVRLSANMIAGHLLLTLIGSTGLSLETKMLMIMLMAQMTLVMLEMAVSLIQAYVFSILTILYASEI